MKTEYTLIIFLLLFSAGCLSAESKNIPGSFKIFDKYAADIFLDDKLQAHPEGRGFALLVGIDDDNYKFSETLSTPAAEVKALKKILEASGYACKTLCNEAATGSGILEWLTYLASLSRKSHSFIFYYAGHGFSLGKYAEPFLEDKKNNTLEFSDAYTHLDSSLVSRYFSPSLDADGFVEFSEIDKIQDFYILCYQDEIKYIDEKKTEQVITTAVGNHEILQVLKTSRFAVKIEIINACSAPGTVIKMPASPSVYYYQLKHQGYLFFCMLKDVIKEKEFSPVILSALKGKADTISGNQNNIVTIFELINYSNTYWNTILKKSGLQDNRIKYAIYCSEDIPLTVY